MVTPIVRKFKDEFRNKLRGLNSKFKILKMTLEIKSSQI